MMFIAYIIIFSLLKPIHPPINYHQFADRRSLWGVSNFADVVSNLFFYCLGVLGLISSLVHIKKVKALNYANQFTRTCYGLFFFSILAVGFGSTYYHLNPVNETLLWDRLPLGIAASSFISALLSEHFSLKFAKITFIPLLLLGIFSVLYWFYTANFGPGDLRPYVALQLFPIIFIPVFLLFYPKPYDKTSYLWGALLFYALARICEVLDKPIYLHTAQVISGHTLKHLMAGLAVLCIYLYLRTRKYNQKLL